MFFLSSFFPSLRDIIIRISILIDRWLLAIHIQGFAFVENNQNVVRWVLEPKNVIYQLFYIILFHIIWNHLQKYLEYKIKTYNFTKKAQKHSLFVSPKTYQFCQSKGPGEEEAPFSPFVLFISDNTLSNN